VRGKDTSRHFGEDHLRWGELEKKGTKKKGLENKTAGIRETLRVER